MGFFIGMVGYAYATMPYRVDNLFDVHRVSRDPCHYPRGR